YRRRCALSARDPNGARFSQGGRTGLARKQSSDRDVGRATADGNRRTTILAGEPADPITLGSKVRRSNCHRPKRVRAILHLKLAKFARSGRNDQVDSIPAFPGRQKIDRDEACQIYALAPWHFLYFFPEPQGHGSLRPTFAPVRTGFGASACAGPV